jgi:hypothetical protein
VYESTMPGCLREVDMLIPSPMWKFLLLPAPPPPRSPLDCDPDMLFRAARAFSVDRRQLVYNFVRARSQMKLSAVPCWYVRDHHSCLGSRYFAIEIGRTSRDIKNTTSAIAKNALKTISQSWPSPSPSQQEVQSIETHVIIPV